jgi:hypothetical protein
MRKGAEKAAEKAAGRLAIVPLQTSAAVAAAAAAATSPACAAKGPAAGSAVPRNVARASVAPAAAVPAPAHAAPAVAAVSAAATVVVGYSSDDDVQVVGEVTTADREAAARAAAVELTRSCGELLVERQAGASHFGFSTDERCVVIAATGGRVIQQPLRCHSWLSIQTVIVASK